MSVSWPSSLQQQLNSDSFSFEIGDTVLRSEMQQGPQKLRRVMTKSVDKITCTINITFAQFADLYYFFDTTTNGGVTPFTFPHPFTGVSTEFRFADRPKITTVGGETFRVSMSWETVPQ